MIKSILEDYEKQKAVLQQERDRLRNENKAISKSMTETFIRDVNKEVIQVHTNQKRIMDEIRELKSGTQEFIRQSHDWISLYDGLLVSLKEAGDVANWYGVLEKRVVTIRDRLKEKRGFDPLEKLAVRPSQQPQVSQSPQPEEKKVAMKEAEPNLQAKEKGTAPKPEAKLPPEEKKETTQSEAATTEVKKEERPAEDIKKQ